MWRRRLSRHQKPSWGTCFFALHVFIELKNFLLRPQVKLSFSPGKKSPQKILQLHRKQDSLLLDHDKQFCDWVILPLFVSELGQKVWRLSIKPMTSQKMCCCRSKDFSGRCNEGKCLLLHFYTLLLRDAFLQPDRVEGTEPLLLEARMLLPSFCWLWENICSFSKVLIFNKWFVRCSSGISQSWLAISMRRWPLQKWRTSWERTRPGSPSEHIVDWCFEFCLGPSFSMRVFSLA